VCDKVRHKARDKVGEKLGDKVCDKKVGDTVGNATKKGDAERPVGRVPCIYCISCVQPATSGHTSLMSCVVMPPERPRRIFRASLDQKPCEPSPVF
jgi:hypothetical protein